MWSKKGCCLLFWLKGYNPNLGKRLNLLNASCYSLSSCRAIDCEMFFTLISHSQWSFLNFKLYFSTFKLWSSEQSETWTMTQPTPAIHHSFHYFNTLSYDSGLENTLLHSICILESLVSCFVCVRVSFWDHISVSLSFYAAFLKMGFSQYVKRKDTGSFIIFIGLPTTLFLTCQFFACCFFYLLSLHWMKLLLLLQSLAPRKSWGR